MTPGIEPLMRSGYAFPSGSLRGGKNSLGYESLQNRGVLIILKGRTKWRDGTYSVECLTGKRKTF